MGMMQMPIDQIVDVVPVRHNLMPPSRAVPGRRVMPAALVLRRAPVRIGRRYLDGVLVNVILVNVVQMAVVQIVDVIAMADGGVPARFAVLVRVVGVSGA